MLFVASCGVILSCWVKHIKCFIYFVFPSGLIFFFVRSDVGLHLNSESTPLLIDRVSVSSVSFIYLLTFLQKGDFRLTDILSRKSERKSVSAPWSITGSSDGCVLLPEAPSDPVLMLFLLQRTHSDSYGPISSEFWMDVSGPKTKKFMWARLISSVYKLTVKAQIIRSATGTLSLHILDTFQGELRRIFHVSWVFHLWLLQGIWIEKEKNMEGCKGKGYLLLWYRKHRLEVISRISWSV